MDDADDARHLGDYQCYTLRSAGDDDVTGTPTNLALAYNLPTTDNLYIGDYRGTCANPLGFVGDIDAVAIAKGLRLVGHVTGRAS